MPRPRKVAIPDIEIEPDVVDNNDISSELISDLEAKKEFDSIVEAIVEEIPEPVEQLNTVENESVRYYKVYQNGVF